MPRHPISFTELTYTVVRESREPLPFAEIMRRVGDITPITTKNPKGTIRAAIGQGRLIVATGDGRYGWLPRLSTGAILRLPLKVAGEKMAAVEFTEEVRDTLWPAFFENQKRNDRSAAHVQLPNEAWVEWPLDFLGAGRWGTHASPEFWQWFLRLKAGRGDQLIIAVADGDERRYRIAFERRQDRDRKAIAQRNRQVVKAALEIVGRSPSPPPLWDITPKLLAAGHYRHPVPPDPLEKILTPTLRKAAQESGAAWMDGSRLRLGDEEIDLAQLLLGGSPGRLELDLDGLLDFSAFGLPTAGRRPRPSRRARKAPTASYTVRVRLRQHQTVWRDIAIAADQTLEELHLAIQAAFEWDNDHLYSFFMSGRQDDLRGEIGSPWSETARHTDEITLDGLGLTVGRKFLYLFDYGDGHEFDVEVTAYNPKPLAGEYPRVVAQHGKAPDQYPDWEE